MQMVRAISSLVLLAALAIAAPKTAPQITFYKDVLPVLQNNCQGCHRPGEAAPVSFLTYKETRPWAKSIKESVRTRKMPPWFADPHVAKYANDRSLKQEDIDLLAKWADTGALEGNPTDAPPAKTFVQGWNIGKPDYIVEMPTDYNVPEKGTIEYTYFVMPTGFTEDKWVQMSEARPGNRAIVHHIIAFIREPGSKWLKNAKPGEGYVPGKGEGGGQGEFLSGYAPGTVPTALKPGQAMLIKAGSDIVLQMHYTTNGKAQSDRTRVGFTFAKETPKERVSVLAAGTNKFVIPPGADNHRVDAKVTLQEDSTLQGLIPHMHLRGKAFEMRAIYPTGEKQDLLCVPHYDFNWQLTYEPDAPKLLPKGTVIESTAWYDNSANNPNNPDPTAEVKQGDQSWEEMMIGFFTVAHDVKLTPRDLMTPKKKANSDKTSGD